MNNKFVIDRIEGEMAVLKNGGQEIKIPIEYLPKNAKEGQIINIAISQNETEATEKKLEAKAILNEILKNGNN